MPIFSDLMTRLIPIIVSILLVSCQLQAQQTSRPQSRSVRAAADVQSFRPIGEIRIWSFFSRGTTFGQLNSVVKGSESINGRDALVIEENLQIDYGKLGAERKVETRGQHYVSTEGYYLGTSYEIGAGEDASELVLNRRENTVEGRYEGDGRERDLSMPFETDRFAWEADFVDQLEILLAMHDITVGDSLIDSIFAPQSMLQARIVGLVERFEWQEIYKDRFDSVFVIHLTEPQEYRLSFTADKRLVKVNMLNRDVRVYQDLLRRPSADAGAAAATRPVARISVRSLFFKLPHYLAYLIIAVASILLVARGGFRWRAAYLSLLGGAALFVLIPFTQIPLQKYLVNAWLIPLASKGVSPYLWSIWLALVTGLVQGLLVLGVLAVVFYRWTAGDHRRAILGAFLGAGFGLVEAIFLTGLIITPLFTWNLLERACLILFHTSAGAIIGRDIITTRMRLIITMAIVVLTNSVIRYLPLFVQQGRVEAGAMHFVLAFITLAFLLFAIIRLRVGEERNPQRARPDTL